MQVDIIDEHRRDDWDRFVNEHPDTISWHLYDWHQILQQHYGLQFFPIAAFEGNDIQGVLPLYYVNTLRSGPALMSIPYFVAGGIVASNEAAQHKLLDRATELSKELKGAPITLKQYGVQVSGDLTTDSGYYNRELPLSRGLGHIWSNMDRVNRDFIDKTEEEDLILEYPSDDFQVFYQVLRQFHWAQGVPCASYDWVHRLVGTGMYKIALLRGGQEIVAATLVKRFKDTVSCPFTCVVGRSPENIRYAFRLYWDLMSRLENESVEVFHSGRIPNDNKVPLYRLGWGGKEVRYYYQYYGNKGETKTETKQKRGWMRTTGTTIWKTLPSPILGVLDPIIIRQFP